MKHKLLKSIDLKSLIIGMLIVLLGFSFYGNSKIPLNEDIIRAKTIIITDGNDNDVAKLFSTKNGGALKIMNPAGKATVFLGTNSGGNGQIIVLDKKESPMVFVGTSKENAGLIRTYFNNKKIATELGKGFLYTFNDKAVVTGYFGTSENNNGIMKTFNKSGNQDSFLGNSYLRFYNDSSKTSCYLGTAEDEGGTLILNDKTGKELFSK